MKRSKFTEQQIAFALKQAELGTPVEEVCRKMGISLNMHWFLSLEDARRKIEEWRQYYNEVRPHSALQWETPSTAGLYVLRSCSARTASTWERAF